MRLCEVVLFREDMPDVKAHFQAATEDWERIKADYINDPAWAKEVEGTMQSFEVTGFRIEYSEKIHKRQDACCNPEPTGGNDASASGV
jgi:hypothetical protein